MSDESESDRKDRRVRIKDYVAEIERQAMFGDPEADHCRADDLLCELLTEIGYWEVVEAWRKVEKWYA